MKEFLSSGVVQSSEYSQLFWLDWKINPDSFKYHAHGAYEFIEQLDEKRLYLALKKIVQNNYNLRSVFFEKDLLLMQKIYLEVEVDLHCFIVKSKREGNATLKKWIRHPFDLQVGPLFRFVLIKNTSSNISTLLLNFHHIILDGIYYGKLIGELECLYKDINFCITENSFENFANYISWEKDNLKNLQNDYWEARLKEYLRPFNLPYDLSKHDSQSFNARMLKFTINKNLFENLIAFNKKYNFSIFHILKTVWSMLIAQYTNQKKITICYPVSITPKKFEKLGGSFINILLSPYAEEGSFLDQLQAGYKLSDLKHNRYFPIYYLLEKISAISENNYLKTFFKVGFASTSVRSLPLQINVKNHPVITPNLGSSELFLEYQIIGNELHYNINYIDGLFSCSHIKRLSRHFRYLLKHLIKQPFIPTNRLKNFSGKSCEHYPTPRKGKDDIPDINNIYELFEKQAVENPNNIALYFENQEITYFDLNSKANQLARYLREVFPCSHSNELSQEVLIAVCMSPSIDLVVAILGILKAGAAYVPVDANLPLNRICEIFIDANPFLVLTDSVLMQHKSKFKSLKIQLVHIDEKAIYKNTTMNLNFPVTRNHLVYALYTSGTTGYPKGVLITHANIVNLIFSLQSLFKINAMTRVLQYTSISFDVFASELFASLSYGGSLYIYPQDLKQDFTALTQYIHKHKINLIPALPAAVLEQITPEEKMSVKTIVIGGEVCAEKAMELWSKYVQLVNAYGPTEACVCTTWHVYQPGDLPNNIGKAIAHTQTYVLDDSLRVCPINVVGELYIGGRGVAKGYLNQPNLTHEKFIKNHFVSEEGGAQIKHSLLYRTGDYVKKLANGDLEFIGRKDDQIKLRGHRIELGEIESILKKHASILQAIVVFRTMYEARRLIAYYVTFKNQEIPDNDLREFILTYLPSYMVPAVFIKITALPLTIHGKIDRELLPDVILSDSNDSSMRNLSTTETKLSYIWELLLGITRIEREDNFFNIGGHSLLVMRLLSEIDKVFSAQLSTNDVFKSPTLQALASVIEEKSKNKIKVGIPKIDNKSPYFIASSAQKSLYFLHKYQETSLGIYNIPIVIEVSKILEVKNISLVINQIIQRHEALRTYFELFDKQVIQRILELSEIEIKLIKCENSTHKIMQHIKETLCLPFDLQNPPLFRASLLIFPSTDAFNLLILSVHHTLMDGHSIQLFVEEFNILSKKMFLPALTVQYKDYARHQVDKILNKKFEPDRTYWLNELKGELLRLNFPRNISDKKFPDFCGGQVNLILHSQSIRNLKNFCDNNKIPIYSLLLAVFGIALYKFTQQEDILLGMPVDNREYLDTQNMIGMFVNTVIIRLKLNNLLTVNEYLKSTRYSIENALLHKTYPLDQLVQELNFNREKIKPSLFNTFFSYQVFNNTALSGDNACLYSKLDSIKLPIAKFDLSLNVTELNCEYNKKIFLNFEYEKNIFDKKTIFNISNNFIKILKQIIQEKHLNEQISKMEILSKKEKELLLNEWNQTFCQFDSNKSICYFFEKKAKEIPNAIALVYSQISVNYFTLNAKANQLARYIRKVYKETTGLNLKPDTLIAICLPRGIEVIISILAILKAGGAYVPLNPQSPNDQLEFILHDTQASLILTSNEIIQKKAFLGNEPIVLINYDLQLWDYLPRHNLKPFSKASDLAYVVYTSGTTGRPKGVMVQHNNLVNCIFALKKLPFNGDPINVTQFASVNFDVYASEIFFSLIVGSCLHIIPSSEKQDIVLLTQFILKNSIDTILFIPPIILQQLSPALPVKTVIIGGEKASQNTIDMWCKHTTLLNVYGPTEATIWSTAHYYRHGDVAAKIGRPLENVKIYILDSALNVCPIGVVGELYIGGAGVARGYLNQVSLTAEKFIHNLFMSLEDKASNINTTLYKTGDLARWLYDGTIEIIGRQDFQIKIRGYRVEINEIEMVLEKCSGVKQCVILAQEENGNKQLIAYYSASNPISAHVLRQFAIEKLPHYMIPSYFTFLESFPLDSNGKLDRRALPKPLHKEGDCNNYIHPKTDLDHSLARIFCEVLEIENCSMGSNFFLLGGNSLTAMYLAHKIEKVLDIDLSVQAVFENPTISMLAKKIALLPISKQNPMQVYKQQKDYPATAVQRGIYLHQETLGKKTSAYNIPIIFEIRDDIDVMKVKLNSILSKLVARHDIFRTNFRIIKGELRQLVQKQLNITINYMGKSSLKDIEWLIFKKILIPFDLKNSALLRADLFTYNKGKSIFLLTIHHILVDAISIKLLTNELNRLYSGESVPEITLQFKDYAIYSESYVTSPIGVNNKNYWLQQLKTFQSLAALPTDYNRRINRNYDGGLYVHLIKPALMTKFRKICKKLLITEHTLLLSIFSILVSHYTRQREVVVGMPLLGRTHPEVQGMIGMFANTMPCFLKLEDVTLSDYIKGVHKQLINIYEHQLYPFDELLKELKVKPNASRHPLFDILFSYQVFNTSDPIHKVYLHPYTLKNSSISTGVSFFDLSLFIQELNNGLKISFQYSIDLFKQESIFRFASSYEQLIELGLDSIGSNLTLPKFFEYISHKILPYVLEKTEIIPIIESIPEKKEGKIKKNVINKLHYIWQEALGISRIDIEDNFFELGGNSLSAMYMLDLISEKFKNANISLSLFQGEPTIQNLYQQIIRTYKKNKINLGEFKDKHLLTLRNGTNEQPIFIIPGFIGFGSGYQSLANSLSTSSSVYGIQMQGIYDGEIPDIDIETIAQRNLEWIYSVQPSGNYYFIGHSFGALVAFEMARQLELENPDRKIAKLVILDTGVNALFINKLPLSLQSCKKILISILSFLLPDQLSEKLLKDDRGGLLQLLAQLNQYKSLDACFKHLIEYTHSLGVIVSLTQIERIYNVAKHNASMRYHLSSTIPYEITVVKCAESDNIIYRHYLEDEKKPCLGWSSYCDKVNVISCEGNHVSMVKNPYVMLLGRLI